MVKIDNNDEVKRTIAILKVKKKNFNLKELNNLKKKIEQLPNVEKVEYDYYLYSDEELEEDSDLSNDKYSNYL